MTTIQQVYNLLRAAGLTRAACLAFLGNWEKESNNEPNHLQGDYSSFRTVSKRYTAGIMDGSISRQQFMTDQKGYGLAQWTYHDFTTGKGRKQALYDYWKQSSMSIDNPVLQVNFALKELKEYFPALLTMLKTTNDLYAATSEICYKFENPKVKNVKERYEAAQEIAQLVSDNPTEEEKTNMKTGKGLAEYAIAQLGKPYWWGTFGQTATAALLAQKRAQYPDYYQASDFQSQFGKKVHDCVGLIKGYRWCDNPNGEPQYVGSQDVAVSGLYNQCSKKGTLSNMPDIPGVCVFQADMGHVGVYIGNGYVVEAMGHAYGVVKTQLHNRNWSLWGMPSWIDYSNSENSEPSTQPTSEQTQPSAPIAQFKTMKTDLPLLKKGAQGIPVKKLQHLLLLEDSCKKLIQDSGGADGDFGSGTEKAVLAYQKAKGLYEDGEAGSEVWASLITT